MADKERPVDCKEIRAAETGFTNDIEFPVHGRFILKA